MSTKVKGDKIKEGSIPLSAFTDDVKGEFAGKYGLSGYCGTLGRDNKTVDTNAYFRTVVYIKYENWIANVSIGTYSIHDLFPSSAPISGNIVVYAKGETLSLDLQEDSNYWDNLKVFNRLYEVPIPTPDYNQNDATAKDYIKNRPFYSFINILFAELNAEESDPNRIEAIISTEDEFCIRTPYWIIGPFNDMDKESYDGLYTPYGNITSVYREDTSFYLNTDVNDTTLIIEWLNENAYVGYNTNNEPLVKHIPDIYISNNIARKSDIVAPNWNAQAGEVGYIKNKPFGPENEVELTIEIKDGLGYIKTNGRFLMYTNQLLVTELENIIIDTFSDRDKTFMYHEPEGLFIAQIYYKPDTYEWVIKTDLDIDTALLYIEIHAYDYLTRISGSNLSNDVIKTTPQTLSDTDKNQALANLGIDPVVWKYMCEPYVINANESNGEIPSDLFDIIFKDSLLLPITSKVVIVKYDDNYYVPTIISNNQIYIDQLPNANIFLDGDGSWSVANME